MMWVIDLGWLDVCLAAIENATSQVHRSWYSEPMLKQGSIPAGLLFRVVWFQQLALESELGNRPSRYTASERAQTNQLRRPVLRFMSVEKWL